MVLYLLPMGVGQSKGQSSHGWGTPLHSFWCCYGSSVESFSKLQDSIYFYRSYAAGSRPGASCKTPSTSIGHTYSAQCIEPVSIYVAQFSQVLHCGVPLMHTCLQGLGVLPVWLTLFRIAPADQVQYPSWACPALPCPALPSCFGHRCR